MSFERTVIANKKIIILDEATAGVDMKTELRIQQMVDTLFEDKTMFIIAHRIQTVLKCDRILVLDAGRVAEFGTISELLALGEDGIFKSIHDQFVGA